MLVAAVAAILDRDLGAVARQVEAYADEQDLWRLPPGLPNCGGTLALHLAGNIQHYLGARLGDTGYLRNRPAEFSARDLPRSALLREIAAAREAVRAAAARVDAERLTDDFPETVGGVRIPTGHYLIHLVAHFAYHLGQLDYHRRLVTGDGRGVGAIRVADLPSVRPAVE